MGRPACSATARRRNATAISGPNCRNQIDANGVGLALVATPVPRFVLASRRGGKRQPYRLAAVCRAASAPAFRLVEAGKAASVRASMKNFFTSMLGALVALIIF